LLSKDLSDHTPLLLDIGRLTSHLFKFELGLLLQDDFGDMVKEICDSVADEDDKMKQWQSKIGRLR
jgi:signal transduction protein with GAF and PtsI domain